MKKLLSSFLSATMILGLTVSPVMAEEETTMDLQEEIIEEVQDKQDIVEDVAVEETTVEEGVVAEEEIINTKVKQLVATNLEGYWYQKNSSWYFEPFEESETGPVLRAGVYKISGYYYYLNNNKMITGWKYIGSYCYYFTNDGVMVSNTSMTIDGKSYTFDTKGHMVK